MRGQQKAPGGLKGWIQVNLIGRCEGRALLGLGIRIVLLGVAVGLVAVGIWLILHPKSADQRPVAPMYAASGEQAIERSVPEPTTPMQLPADDVATQASAVEADTSLSDLPPELRKLAESSFASQHDNWLGIGKLAAKCQWDVKMLKNGKWEDLYKAARTGTLEFDMVPLTPAEARALGRPEMALQLQWSVYNNETQWHAQGDDVLRNEENVMFWMDGHESEKSNTRQPFGIIPTDLFNVVFSTMGQSYKDGQWAGSDHTQDHFFKHVAPPLRMSTDEETQNLLGGEKAYMFMPNNKQPRIWVNAQTGQFYQVDTWDKKTDVLKTIRYVDYKQDPVTKRSFPTTVVNTFLEGHGPGQQGWQFTLKLSDLQITPSEPRK